MGTRGSLFARTACNKRKLSSPYISTMIKFDGHCIGSFPFYQYFNPFGRAGNVKTRSAGLH